MATEKKKIAPMGINLSYAQRPLVEALLISNDGDDLCDASEELKKLTKAVQDAGGKGHVTIKLEMSGLGKKAVLGVTVTSKIPKEKRPRTSVFADENGNLCVHDPDRYQLDFSSLLEEEEEDVSAKA